MYCTFTIVWENTSRFCNVSKFYQHIGMSPKMRLSQPSNSIIQDSEVNQDSEINQDRK